MAILIAMLAVPVSANSIKNSWLPWETGSDKVPKDRLASEICSYMLEESKVSLEDLRDAAFVFAYWTPKKPYNFTLQIFGNANKDGIIDIRDLVYIKEIMLKKKPETRFADANHDGKIDEQDCTQIKLIIKGEEKELTLIDAANRTVTVPMPVERICTQYEAAAGAIRALGAKDKIVCVGSWLASKRAKFYPELSKRPVAGSWSGPNIEEMLNLKTQIVITYPLYRYREEIEDAGIKVVCFLFGDPSTIKEQVMKLGYLLGKREKAIEYIEWYNQIMDRIESKTSKIPEENKPRVFLDTTWKLGSTERHTVSNGTGLHWICVKAGGINIAANVTGKVYQKYPTVSAEWVLAQNPDVIVGVSYKGGYTGNITELKEMYNDIVNLFNKTKAVDNGKVFIMSGDVRWGLQVPIAVAYMAKWLHPNLFNLTIQDIQEMHQEFINKFCPGLEFDVTEEGAFVYP